MNNINPNNFRYQGPEMPVEARPRQGYVNSFRKNSSRATSQRIPNYQSSQQGPNPFGRPRSINNNSNNIEPTTNVFINYIPAEFTEMDLRQICSEFGEIMTSKIMINLETGQSKCFGFVRFRTLQQAQSAIEGLNGRAVGNKRLLAKYAESHEKKEKASMTIYIKRLPMTVNSMAVTQMFSHFGDIIQIVPHILDTIDPQYWRCFIRYTSYEAASSAIAAMNNQIVVQGSRPIHVRYADESRLSGSLTYNESLMHNVVNGGSQSLLDNGDDMSLLPSFLFQ